jgi:hypothetical protein
MAKKIERSSMTQTDAQGRVLREARDNSMGEAKNFRWWKVDEKDMAQAIASTVRFIQRHQSSRMEQLTVSTRLYGNSSAYNLLGTAFTRSSSVNSNPMSQRLCFNLIQSVIDTLTAKMAKNKVIPTYITNGGIWNVQKKAKQLTKFAQGFCYEQKIHEKAIIGFSDGGVWGDGFVHVFERDGRAVVERVLPHEIVVDLIESMCEEPRQLHRVKIVDRDIAMELFPDLEEHIALVSPANYQEIGGQGTAADLITVTESWHLPSAEGAGDGVKVITVGDGAMIDEWKKDYFPFPHFRYNRKKLGWYSQGAAERLQTIQGEINRSMMLKQKSMWMQGSFKILVENGSKVVAQHLNNDVGSIVYYTGTPPQYVTPPSTNMELQEWIDSLIQKGYQQEGVSQLSAASEKPMGVDSGKAMRTMTDIEDDRFLFVSQEMESFVLEIVRQGIEVVKDIYKDKGTYEVVFPTTRFIETVDWKGINLKEDSYVLKAYPTSSLADDLTGRLSDVQELMQAGLISPRTGQRLMDMPDIEMNETLANAPEDLLHKVIEEMCDDGEYMAPEPSWDLKLASQLILEYLNYAQFMNAPESVLNKLRRFNQQLKDMTGVMATAMQPPPGGPPGPGAPMANPAAPPTSNLIPNVNTQGAA